MLTLGLAQDPDGSVHLLCAATHLTAFTGARGGKASTHFTVNVVHPIDDFGSVGVRAEGTRGPVCSCLQALDCMCGTQ